MKFHKQLFTGISFILLLASQAFGENLLTANPGFEEGAKHWKGVDGTYWRLSKTAAPWSDGGDQALQRIGFKGSKAGAQWTLFNEQKIPVSAGQAYELAVGARGIGGGDGGWTLCPVLEVRDAGGKVLTVLEGQKISKGTEARTYSRLSSVLTMPEGAAQVRAGVRVKVDQALTDIAYLNFDTLWLDKAKQEDQP